LQPTKDVALPPPLTMKPTTANHARLQPLDALRGIAALSVVLFHFALGREGYDHIFRFGTTGVDLFFMISGFVIFMSLEKADSLRTFVVNRFTRLYPAYWMGVIFSFTLISIHFHYSSKYPLEHPWSTLAGNLTMFQYYMHVPDLEGPYWTMIVEMLFYILMGLVFLFRKLNRTFFIGGSLCTLLLISAFYVDQIGWLKEIFMKLPLLYHFPLFFAGMAFYGKYTNNWTKGHFRIAVALAFITQMALFPHTWRACKHMSQWEYLIVLTAFFCVFGLFIQGKLERIANPVTLFVGKISYPLYLTHQYLSINLIIPYMMWKHDMQLWQASLLVALPVSLAVAYIIHYFAEVKATHWLKKKLLLPKK
jgi:peptidoglycan/LPS O-acetylase OafA/YrhL